MPPDEPSGARPAPVVLRIKLRYEDVETLAARFAPNVGKSGLFLPTKSLQAVGAEVKFELRLADDKVVITGLGKVRAAKAADPANPRAAFGMAIELTRVTRESRDVILKVLAKRRELGLADVAIPMPADIDAAKGESRETTNTAPVEVTPPPGATTIDRAPSTTSASRDSAPILDTGPIRDSQPILDSSPLPRAAPEQARVLTAPRRASGPIAVAKVHTVEALAPEAPRRKRPALQEVLDRASGPVAAVSVDLPGLDDDVDVAAVMAMARALAGSDLDAELESLRESASAPIEITVEAASAELAHKLGGAAVRRSWAPPPPVESVDSVGSRPVVVEPAPAVVDATPEVAPVADVASEVGPVAAVTDAAAPVDAAVADAAPVDAALEIADQVVPERAIEVTRVERAADVTRVEAVPEPVSPLETAPVDVSASEPVVSDEPTPVPSVPEPAAPSAFALSDEDAVPGEDHEVDPEQIADEIHQLGEGDFEEVEHTMIGGEPEPEPELTPVYTEPSVAAAIEASLDQQLADADAEPDDLGFAPPAAYAEPAYAEPAYAEPAYAEPAPEPAPGYAEPGTDGEYNEEELEEIEDFEILAEADEEDADLLSAHGEEEASGTASAYVEPAPEPAPRPSYDYSRHSDPDFHARLELSDMHPRVPASDEDDDEPPLHLDPRELSARQAMAALDDSQNQYELPHDDFDSPHSSFEQPAGYARAAPVASGFPPLSRFDESDVHPVAPEPQYLRPSEPPRRGDDGYDLETALEALDVDLDDLAIPHAKTERGPTIPPANRPRTASQRVPVQRAPSSARPQTRAPRANTDDGVLIDFDDDE